MSADARCPLCLGPTDAAFSVGDRNREISAERFDYRHCCSCGTTFLLNPPDDLGSYYPTNYYQLPPVVELDCLAAAEAPKLALLRPFVTSGHLIEIGAASGVFARAARNDGFDVTAIEMDAHCCEYLEEVVDVCAVCSGTPERALSELEPARAIVLWHVLEHLPHPWEVIGQAARRLEQGGILALSTPNPDSFQFRLLGARWPHIDAPRHLFLIPFPALKAHAAELGLEVAEVTTTDPPGKYLNWFGWEYAVRRRPARHPSTPMTRMCAHLLNLSFLPVERRGMNGAAYTAVFIKP